MIYFWKLLIKIDNFFTRLASKIDKMLEIVVHTRTLFATCEICTHRWLAEFPEDAKRIQCPHCEYMNDVEHLEDEQDELYS